MLTAQSAFVDQTLGDVPSAEKAYQMLFAFKAELDPAVTAVAANNMVRIRGQRDFFDSWKKCKANLSEGLAKKLTPAQRMPSHAPKRSPWLAASGAHMVSGSLSAVGQAWPS